MPLTYDSEHPLPPTFEQQGYGLLNRINIHILDDDSLLQIFSCYRLEEGNNWKLWRKLTHTCRRWRNLIYGSLFHLDICLLLTNNSPSLNTLSHLPPLPLIIDYSDRTGALTQKEEDNLRFGLQQHGHLRQVVLQAPSSRVYMWIELMNNPYPRLWHLSLSSTTTEGNNPMLPVTLQAPGLRHLSLHGINISRGLPFPSSTVALSTLSLTCVGASSHFTPGHLVTQLQCLPHLEELSISFTISIPLPGNKGGLLPAPNPCVTLPTLRQLTFVGEDAYLDTLAAQIYTPLLERLTLTLFFDFIYTIVNLTEFIRRTERFQCVVVKIIFNKDTAVIDVGQWDYSELRVIGELSLRVNCKPLNWQIDSATQVYGALGKVLSAVEELILDLDADGMPSDWENTLDSMVWYELLLPFIGVKKLHIGPSLTLELSNSLNSLSGGLILELLPELYEIRVQLRKDDARDARRDVFFLFIETRESVGRPVYLSFQRQRSGPDFPSALQDLLSNEFKYALRRCPISYYHHIYIVHRFRILVVGRVRVVKPHTQAVDATDVCSIAARVWQVLTHKCRFQCGHVGLYLVIVAFLPHEFIRLAKS